MAAINFYLRKPNAKISPIEVSYHFKGIRLRLCIGEYIEPKKWNKAKQRAKETELTTKDGDVSLNGFLNKLSDKLRDFYNAELNNGVPTKEILKASILSYLRPVEAQTKTETLYNLIERFINNEITVKGEPKSPATIKTYKTTKMHLKEFERAAKYKIDFDTITLDFYHKFTSYLKQQGKAVNSIGKYIQVVKVFMNTAVDLRLTTNEDFKKKAFAVIRKETDAVHLTNKEIIDFYNFDLSKTPKLENVRDLFVFGCFIGQRFSDFTDIQKNNRVTITGEDYLKVNTKKTKEPVIIPCSPIVKQIFQKYSELSANSLPKSISNQKFNEYIKEAAKAAGLVERGRLIDNLDAPLFECISSHTCRRSFATNYYGTLPIFDIMQITGHKSERSFLRYIKTSKQVSASKLAEVMNKEHSQNMLKVVND